MIFRVFGNKLYPITLPSNITEDVFLKAQAKGKVKFLKVHLDKLPQLPDTLFSFIETPYYEYKNGKVVFDLERIKQSIIKNLSERTQQYIDSIFQKLDWGQNEADALASMRNTIDVNLEEVLYLLTEDLQSQGKDASAVSLSTFWRRTAQYFAKKYTSEDAVNEMKKLGIAEGTQKKVLKLLSEVVEAAKLKLWDEEVWNYEKQLEEKIRNAKSIEEIDQIMKSVQFPAVPEV